MINAIHTKLSMKLFLFTVERLGFFFIGLQLNRGEVLFERKLVKRIKNLFGDLEQKLMDKKKFNEILLSLHILLFACCDINSMKFYFIVLVFCDDVLEGCEGLSVMSDV